MNICLWLKLYCRIISSVLKSLIMLFNKRSQNRKKSGNDSSIHKKGKDVWLVMTDIDPYWHLIWLQCWYCIGQSQPCQNWYQYLTSIFKRWLPHNFSDKQFFILNNYVMAQFDLCNMQIIKLQVSSEMKNMCQVVVFFLFSSFIQFLVEFLLQN